MELPSAPAGFAPLLALALLGLLVRILAPALILALALRTCPGLAVGIGGVVARSFAAGSGLPVLRGAVGTVAAGWCVVALGALATAAGLAVAIGRIAFALLARFVRPLSPLTGLLALALLVLVCGLRVPLRTAAVALLAGLLTLLRVGILGLGLALPLRGAVAIGPLLRGVVAVGFGLAVAALEGSTCPAGTDPGRSPGFDDRSAWPGCGLLPPLPCWPVR